MTDKNKPMRKRVLLLAEMANPEWPSVPLIGWQNAVYLRAVADTHLVTQIRNKAAIERMGWQEGIEFTSIDSEAIARLTHRLGMWLGAKDGKGWTTGMALSVLSTTTSNTSSGKGLANVSSQVSSMSSIGSRLYPPPRKACSPANAPNTECRWSSVP